MRISDWSSDVCSSDLLPSGKLALVDFPDHSNVGDSAIWLGEMAYLRKNNRLPAYHSAIADFDDEACRAAIGDGPILIHGGGNMGTLWPKHEAFRPPLLRPHRGHPIVTMPQSTPHAHPIAKTPCREKWCKYV